MNPEVKEIWLNALRSGEYQQAFAVLRGRSDSDAVGYCCLGVLTCEYIKHTGDARLVDGTGVGASGMYSEEYYNDVRLDERDRLDTDILPDERDRLDMDILPVIVADWAGLDRGNPEIWLPELDSMDPVSLATMNDEFGMPFTEIADVIDQHL